MDETITEEEIIELDCTQRVATEDKAADADELKPNLDHVVEEWKTYCRDWKASFQESWRTKKGVVKVKDFTIRTFTTTLITGIALSALHFYDFVVDNKLGWEYIFGTEQIHQTENVTAIPQECTLLGNSSNPYDLNTLFVNTSTATLSFTYSCGKPSNMFFGIITLLIPFLPGIQWYASVKTDKHHFGKFVSSLFFPFFMIFFKVRCCFVSSNRSS